MRSEDLPLLNQALTAIQALQSQAAGTGVIVVTLVTITINNHTVRFSWDQANNDWEIFVDN